MNKSEAINELSAALAKAQGAIKNAVKDSTNPHFKSRYADLASVWEACRQQLAENGLSVVQLPVDSAEGRVALETVLTHSSGQWISTTVSARVVKDDPQGVGSALTYLRRYSLAAVAGVASDDDDGNAASAGPGLAKAAPSKPTASNSEQIKRFTDRLAGVQTSEEFAAALEDLKKAGLSDADKAVLRPRVTEASNRTSKVA